jgi:tetratricopeptide (TPR) repeat protein
MIRISKALAATVMLAIAMPVASTAAPKRLVAMSVNNGQTVMKARLVREVVEADALMLKQKYADAAELYHQGVNKDPKNVVALTGLGMALGKQFKLDAAEDQFNKVLLLEPQNAMAHVGKAMVDINRLQSSSATVQKNRDHFLKDAESQAREALLVDPGLPEAHFYLGQALREQGRLDEAAEAFRLAIQNEPQYSEAYAGLGMVRLTQNSPVEAEANFKQAAQLNTGNSTAHFGLGRVYLQQGKVDEAIHELNTALYQFPNSAPTRLALGEAYLQQGNTIAAVKEFQEAIRIKPENSDAYLHIAAIRESRGDLEHALAELRSGLEMMPNNPELHLRVADDSLRLEKLDDAIKEYAAVMNGSTPLAANAAKGITRAYVLKAQKQSAGAFLASNDYESAKAQLNKAIELNPNDMELRLAQAKLRSLSGEQVDLKAIGAPKTDGERIAYAEALLAQNRFAEAHEQLNTLLAGTKDAKQILSVADLSYMIKDLTTAEAAYKKAAAMPLGAERAERGLAQVAKLREAARQDYTLADDLARRKALASAIDRYHASIYANPELANSRVGLARALERYAPQRPERLQEAIVQYKAYMALSPDLPQKEVEKLNKKITQLSEKSSKLEHRLALRPTP